MFSRDSHLIFWVSDSETHLPFHFSSSRESTSLISISRKDVAGNMRCRREKWFTEVDRYMMSPYFHVHVGCFNGKDVPRVEIWGCATEKMDTAPTMRILFGRECELALKRQLSTR